MSELRIVISNTGPLLSAFQCGRMDILRQFYDEIHIPASQMFEFEKHGAGPEIGDLILAGFVVVHDDLTVAEQETAREIADAIARSPKSRDEEAVHHLPEAEATALMGRSDLPAVEILLDELAAREVAEQRGIPIVGFPGLLVRACRQGIVGPEEVRAALLECRRQGTHYASAFIEAVYRRLWEERK